MARILLLDDESELREEIADFLRRAGHEIDEAGSIRQFRAQFTPDQHQIVVIDRALPDGDGLELVGELRSRDLRCGVVVFTARDGSLDRISGYQHGADHYLTKPIRLEELAAVLQTLAWRVSASPEWRLDPTEWTLLTPDRQPVRLTALEHGLLQALARSPSRTLSRRQIVEGLGKDMASYDPRNLDALVLRLRRKVAEVSASPLPLRAVHGTGYALTQTLRVD